jgi:hypothetical protein
MYTWKDINELKTKILKIPNTEYCNILSDVVFNIINGQNSIKEEYLLREEWDNTKSYHEYVIEAIQRELTTKYIAFISLSNSSGDDKTFIHEFIMFKTNNGIIRMESYGKDFIYTEGKKCKGYNLYHAKLVQWNDWEIDLKQLLTISPGEKRIKLWNKIFSSIETIDTEFYIDVIMFL